LAFLFILGQFIDLGIDMGKLVSLEGELGSARLKVDGYHGAIFLSLLHVVNVDVVAEHGASIAVLAGYRRACEGDKSSIRQGISKPASIMNFAFKPIFAQ